MRGEWKEGPWELVGPREGVVLLRALGPIPWASAGGGEGGRDRGRQGKGDERTG